MKRCIALPLVAVDLLSGCSNAKTSTGGTPTGGTPTSKETDTEGPLPSCEPAPTPLAGTPSLPTGFPTLTEVTFTGTAQQGPSTVVSGYWTGDLDSAFSGFKSAFTGAAYTVTNDEMDEHDAEVNFSGGNSTGQVKLMEECEGRVDVTITVRPGS